MVLNTREGGETLYMWRVVEEEEEEEMQELLYNTTQRKEVQ